MTDHAGVGSSRHLLRCLPVVLGCLAVAGCGGSPAPADVSRSSTSPGTGTGPQAREAQGCPRTPGGRRAKGVGIALGPGPAYPVLGMLAAPPAAGGVAVLADDIQVGDAYLHKTLWAVRPGERSELAVRAESLSTGRPVDFFEGPEPQNAADLREGTRAALRLARRAGRWAYAPTTTVLPGPGCYAFGVRGPGLDQRIVFRAVLRIGGGQSPGERRAGK